MGPVLRAFVEEKLVADLNVYLTTEKMIQRSDVVFDWSESCIEGHRAPWLDGAIENFSGVAVFDTQSNLVAEGWMEFIETNGGLEVFWWFLTGADQSGLRGKTANEVPKHVWDRLDPQARSKWVNHAPKLRREW